MPEPTASATPARLYVPPVAAPSSVLPTTPQQGHPQPPACLTGLAGGTRLRTQDGAQKGRGAEANMVTAFARRWHESIILTRCAQPQALRDGCPCCSQGRALEDTGHPDALKPTEFHLRCGTACAVPGLPICTPGGRTSHPPRRTCCLR